MLDSYVEPVNLDKAMSAADLGLTEALDGDSAYLDAEEFKAYQHPPRQADADIGVALTRRFSFLMVVGVRPASPADKAGIKPGDILKTIDGHHTRPLSVPIGEHMLQGAPGSVVKIKVLRAASDPLDLSLVRERRSPIPVERKVLETGVGYLKLAEFTSHSGEEVRSDLERLKQDGARSLVLDLREAAFGQPADAARVAELFLKGGMVAKLTGRKAPDEALNADPAKNAWDQPLVVLIDTGTAGPGEIVAASLSEAGRALLVGEHTFGRAGVQKAFPLYEGGLVITVAKYVTPKGAVIHGKGLEPTVAVDTSSEEGLPEGAAPRDLILQKGIEVLKNPPPAKKAA